MIVGLNSLEEDDRKVANFPLSSFSVIALEGSEGCSFSISIRHSAKEADRSPWSRKPRGVHSCTLPGGPLPPLPQLGVSMLNHRINMQHFPYSANANQKLQDWESLLLKCDFLFTVAWSES